MSEAELIELRKIALDHAMHSGSIHGPMNMAQKYLDFLCSAQPGPHPAAVADAPAE